MVTGRLTAAKEVGLADQPCCHGDEKEEEPHLSAQVLCSQDTPSSNLFPIPRMEGLLSTFIHLSLPFLNMEVCG